MCETSSNFTYEVIQNWTNYVPDVSTVEVKTERYQKSNFYITARSSVQI